MIYQPKPGETFSVESEAGTYRYEGYDPTKDGTAGSGRIESSGPDVAMLSANWNADAINLMRDEWFDPMAPETCAWFKLASKEAPDFIVSLHPHAVNPSVDPTAYGRKRGLCAVLFCGRASQDRYRVPFKDLFVSWRTVCVLVAGCLCGAVAFGQEATVAVRLTVVEMENGPPLPCRVHLKDSRDRPVQPNGLPFWKDHFVCSGEVALPLAPGDYTYEIERGPEYLTATGKLVVAASTAGQTTTNRLRRLTDLAKEGWWSGELHVHRPVADVELLMRAEDLHVAPVITWWNDFNAWARQPLPAAPLTRFDGDRFYHVMGGEDERGGGALLFFNLQQPLNLEGAKREYPSPMKFLREARRHASVWVDLEKPFWYDAPVWLASGLVDSVGIANNHMQRSGMMANEAWGRARDKQRLPDPNGNGLWTQEIYYHGLNCGLRLPPSAGSASGVLPNPVGYNRVYVHLDGELSYENWWGGLRAGRVFVSNGPLLRCRANGRLPGHVFTAPAGEEVKLQIEAALDSRDPVPAIEIIKNGRVDRVVPFAEWKRTGSLGELAFKESGWFLVRAIADAPRTFRFASTGPFYVEVGAAPRRISKSSAQFFLDWVRERMNRINLDDPKQRAEVLEPHRAAERFWQDKVTRANAE